MESFGNMLISEETRVLLSVANIGALVFVIWAVAKIYFTFKSKSDLHDISIKNHANQIEALKNENNNIKITQAVIETKLENIEVGIVDIKSMLVTHMQKE